MVLPSEFLLAVEIHGGDGEEFCCRGRQGNGRASVVRTSDLDVGEPGLGITEGGADDGVEILKVLRRRSVLCV